MKTDPREIQQMEELCVQNHAPACEAACPVHVNVKAMAEAVKSGDFTIALKIFNKKVPFPGILARICDHPCQTACRRREVGGAIAISDLERACVEFSTAAVTERIIPPPLKNKRVAIAGGGLSGLSAAMALAKKGYSVSLCEAAGQLGGKLREMPEERLPGRIIDDETSVLSKSGVEIHLNTAVEGDVGLSDLLRDFDAVYMGVGSAGLNSFRLGVAEGEHYVDPVTFATAREGVFAGGSLLRQAGGYSPVQSVSDGHRAAVSIERYLKGVSQRAGRTQEGSYVTRLHTNIRGLAAQPVVVRNNPAGGYTEAEAAAEAARCLQCQCLECVKGCRFLAVFKEFPGECIRKVTKNLIILPGMGHRTMNRFINSCSLCGLCGVVCPTGLDMAAINSAARGIMVKKNYMPPATHDFPIRDMLFSNGEKFALARHQPGQDTSTYLFFPGCQLSASEPGYTEKVYAYLRDNLGGGVGLMLRCCGAPALWAGREALFQAETDSFRDKWENMRKPMLIIACPTCYWLVKKHMPDVAIKSLWEVLEEIGLPAEAPNSAGRTVAVHDSCMARFEPQIQESVRRLALQLGCIIEELPFSREKTKCCGYGGLMYQVNPELTEEVIRDRLSESPTDYLTYCSNCRDFFAGKGKRAFHLLELIFSGGEDRSLGPGPGFGFSQRHENRIRLKKKLLQEVWGETVLEEHEYSKTELLISPAIQEKMEKDSILAEDVQQVINHAEKTGNKVFFPDSGHYIAHLKPSIITYWVEYSVDRNRFVIHNAYSHRMQIVEEVTPV